MAPTRTGRYEFWCGDAVPAGLDGGGQLAGRGHGCLMRAGTAGDSGPEADRPDLEPETAGAVNATTDQTGRH